MASDLDAVDPAVWRTAVAVIVGALAVVFDTTIVSVALDSLASQLHASLGTIQWVSTGYLLALFVTIPIAGWAQSVIGGKRLWIAALGVFLLGSVLSAASWNAPSLIAFRALQGIGGGILMPLMATLIMQAAKGRNVGKVMATATIPGALGPVLGPVLGGVILQLGSWRWLFLVNIPFCVVGAWLAARNLPMDKPGPRTRLDVIGLLLLSPGVAAVVYGLSQFEGSSGLASAQVLVPLIGGLALVAGFVAWSLPRGEAALVDLRLLRHRPVASSAAMGFVYGVALYGAMLVLPLYWQRARGEDALGAAFLLVPQGIGTLLARSLAGRFMDRSGARWVAFAGFTVVAAATVPFAFVTAGTSKTLLMVTLLIRGIGLGAASVSVTAAAYVGLGREEVPHASIITRVGQQVGGSFGTALLAMILTHTVAGARTPAALAKGFGNAFWWSAAFAVLAIPLSLSLPGRIQRPLPGIESVKAADLVET